MSIEAICEKQLYCSRCELEINKRSMFGKKITFLWKENIMVKYTRGVGEV